VLIGQNPWLSGQDIGCAIYMSHERGVRWRPSGWTYNLKEEVNCWIALINVLLCSWGPRTHRNNRKFMHDHLGSQKKTCNQWTMLQNEIHEFDEVCPWPLGFAILLLKQLVNPDRDGSPKDMTPTTTQMACILCTWEKRNHIESMNSVISQSSRINTSPYTLL
jgi:hypothetical protein